MVEERKSSRIKLDELMYYFDCQEKDSIDNGKIARKVGQVLTLRTRLLALPPEEFDQAIAAIERLISNAPSDAAPTGKEARSQRQREALELFEKANNKASVRVSQVSKV